MDAFYRKIVEYQREMAADLQSENLSALLTKMIGDLMQTENVMLVGVDEELLGPWAEKTEGWKIKGYSLDVIRKAISSKNGFCKAGVYEENPSKSQVAGNILSCLAARVEAAGKILAVIYCDVRKGLRRFTDEDGNRLKLIADCCAVYVMNLVMQRKDRFDEHPLPDPAAIATDNILIGESSMIRSLKSEISSLARIDSAVLILGETGTGKEVIARALHYLSPRAKREFVPVNCAAINAGTFESDLFGHERGAFSGAYKKREGKILRADGGTLFLDEVGDIPMDFQIKLLRVLETKRVTPVGADFELPVDFRLVCATNRDLKKMGSEKTFRDDLLYRISDVQVRISPLRTRPEDIPLLAAHFASPRQLTEEAMELLKSVSDWPGNVRQLRKTVETACKLCEGHLLTKDDIAKQLEYQDLLVSTPVAPLNHSADLAQDLTYRDLRKKWQNGDLSALDLASILKSLYAKSRNNWARAAKQLGISTPEEMKAFRNWIYYLQKTHVIAPGRPG